MTESHIEKAAETVLGEFARWNRAVEPREAELVSRAALDAAFAELAANPPERAVKAMELGDDEWAEAGLSAAFSALRKGDSDG